MSGMVQGLAERGAPQEKVDLLVRIRDTIGAMGLPSVDFEAENIYFTSQAEDRTAAEAVEMLEDFFHGCLDSLLANQGIFMVDATALADKIVVLEDLQKLTNNDNPELFLAQSDSSDVPEECLSNMLEVVGDYTAEQYLLLIERIGSQVIARIKDMYKDEEIVPAPADPQRALSRERLKFYAKEDNFSYVYELIEDGMAAGMPVSAYVNEVDDLLRAMKVPSVHEWLSIVLASDTPQDRVFATVLEEIEAFYGDATFVINARRELETVYKGFV